MKSEAHLLIPHYTVLSHLIPPTLTTTGISPADATTGSEDNDLFGQEDGREFSLEQSFHQAKRVQLMSNACAMDGSCPEWMGFALSVPRLTVQTAEQLNQIAVVGGKVTTTWLLWVGRHQKTWLSMVGYLFFIQS